MDNIDELKPIIRSILLSLGKQATEKAFRSEYYNQEGESFNKVLSAAQKNFSQFMRGIPDVCRVWDNGQEIMLQRVSTETSSHMDTLTIVTKKRLRSMPLPAKFRPNFGSYHRPATNFLPFFPQRQFNNFYQNQGLNSLPLYATLANFNHTISKFNSGFNVFNTQAQKATGYQPPKAPIYQPPQASSFKPSSSNVRPTVSSFKPNPQVSRKAFASRPITKLPPKITDSLPPLRHQNWPKVSINPETEEEIQKQEDEKPGKLSTNADSIESLSSSDWSVKSAEVEGKKNPFLEALKVKFRGITRKSEDKPKVEVEVPAVSKPKVAKFQETDVRVGKPTNEKVVDPRESPADLGTFITGRNFIRAATMKQLKFPIAIPIQVIDVRSVSYFIFQFNVKELIELQEEMSIFYKSLEDSEHLRVKNVFVEMPVATFHDGQWQRAEILLICRNKVMIRFIDTLKLIFTSTQNLRYLEKTFAISTRKACPGTLAGVEPKNDAKSFNADAIGEFERKVRGGKLYAIVKGEAEGVFKLSMFEDSARTKKIADQLVAHEIVDKNNYEDMSINAILI